MTRSKWIHGEGFDLNVGGDVARRNRATVGKRTEQELREITEQLIARAMVVVSTPIPEEDEGSRKVIGMDMHAALAGLLLAAAAIASKANLPDGNLAGLLDYYTKECRWREREIDALIAKGTEIAAEELRRKANAS